MGHYALINEDNIVEQVIVGPDENTGIDYEEVYTQQFNLTCKRTSYNTRGNTHLLGDTPFRGNYAGIGYTYDEDRDVFISPQPYPSWNLNEDTYLWEPPIDRPTDGQSYLWNEEEQKWDLYG